mgnify:CR=1 FL=1
MPLETSVSAGRIPVTVLTGFLGAGKTTLLNRILSDVAGQQYAVIVNEFGDIGIDADLIKTGDEELIELNSGCICCVIRGDLIRTIRSLLLEKRNLDGIIIETTGLANPSPIIQTMVIDKVIGAQCYLDSVLCVVDAVHVLSQLEKNKDVADQIVFSDHIVLNKVNDASVSINDLEMQLKKINPFAPITCTNRANIPVTSVLNQCKFDLNRIEDQLSPQLEEHSHDNHIDHNDITSISLTCDTPLDSERLEEWLRELLSRRGSDILRTKGVMSIKNDDRKLILQAVNMMVEGDFFGNWNSNPRQSKLVFIGRRLNLDELRTGFLSCSLEVAA